MSTIDPDRRPDGVDDALETLAHLDAALLGGLSRLTGPARDAVEGLGGLFAGTPLAGPVDEALAGFRRGTPTEHDARAFAAARASLQGAVHDALLADVCEALGRARPDDHATGAPSPFAPEDEAPLRNARHWLLELATAGLSQVSPDAVAPFASTLETLAERPRLARPAAILTGLFDELAQALPLTSRDDAPTPRWPDLWTRALLASFALSEEISEAVTGTFAPLGVDVRHHDHAIGVTVYGVFDGAILRSTFTGWKVDALLGPEALRTLPEPASVVLDAVAKGHALTVSGRRIGDDLVIEEASLGAPSAPYESAIEGLRFPLARPYDRHPAQLAIPVMLKEASVRAEGDGHVIEPLGLRVAEERISPLYGAKKGDLTEAKAVFGLVRWDAAYAFQPLDAVLEKGVRWGLGEPIAEAQKPKKATDALSVLEERASKLLRRK